MQIVYYHYLNSNKNSDLVDIWFAFISRFCFLAII